MMKEIMKRERERLSLTPSLSRKMRKIPIGSVREESQKEEEEEKGGEEEEEGGARHKEWWC